MLGVIAACLAMITVRIYAPNPDPASVDSATSSTDVLADVIRRRWATNQVNRSLSSPRSPLASGSSAADSDGEFRSPAGSQVGRGSPKASTSRASAGVVDPPGGAIAGAATANGTELRYFSVPNEGRIRIDGTSTIHDWHAESTVIGGTIEAEADFPNATRGKVSPKVDINIPVRTLKSSEGRKMDVILQEHMNAAEHKMIKYRVLELVPKAPNPAAGVDYDANGTLTISGRTKTNTMPVTISKVGSKIKVLGSTSLRMTDYGIQPPAPDIGLGLIKTGDEVKLTFEWVTETAREGAPASP